MVLVSGLADLALKLTFFTGDVGRFSSISFLLQLANVMAAMAARHK
jgi:hypothetical protein